MSSLGEIHHFIVLCNFPRLEWMPMIHSIYGYPEGLDELHGWCLLD